MAEFRNSAMVDFKIWIYIYNPYPHFPTTVTWGYFEFSRDLLKT